MNNKEFHKQFKLIKSFAKSIEKHVAQITYWRKVDPQKNTTEASITVFTRWAHVLKDQVDRYKFSVSVLGDMVIISGNDAWQSEQQVTVDRLKSCIPEMTDCQVLVYQWVDTLTPKPVH